MENGIILSKDKITDILPTNERLLQNYGFPPNMAAKDVTFVKRGMVFYVTELVCISFILRDRSFILYQREIFVDKFSDLI